MAGAHGCIVGLVDVECTWPADLFNEIEQSQLTEQAVFPVAVAALQPSPRPIASPRHREPVAANPPRFAPRLAPSALSHASASRCAASVSEVRALGAAAN